MTRLALRNPVAILMAAIGICVLGVVSLQKLPVDLFPKINVPVILVGVKYPGASPAAVESTVSYVIERAVSACSGLERVTSVSKQGFAAVRVWFKWGTDINAAMLEVTQRVQSVRKNLPRGIYPPFVVKFDISNFPIALIGVSGGGYDEKALWDLAYNVISPQLETTDGVSAANVVGGKVRQISVELDADRMRERGVSAIDVEDAVQNANLISASGSIGVGGMEYNVFANTQFDLVRPMGDIVVKVVRGVPIRIKDVGRVVDSHQVQLNFARVNNQRGVYLQVYRQPGTNTLDVIAGLRKTLEKLNGVPRDVKLSVMLEQGKYIRNSISSLQHEAAQGGALALLVIIVFLGSLRSTLIVSVSIPLSIMATFVLLQFSGQTLNTFTLGGLALAVGPIIDYAIVALENIHRHHERGETAEQAALVGAQEVSTPMFTSMLTTLVVFFPVVFLTGVSKYLFVPLALAVGFSIVSAYLTSMTVVPALCRRVYERADHGGAGRRWSVLAALQRLLDRLDQGYRARLRIAVRWRRLVIGLCALLFLSSLGLLRFIGSEFFPESDEAQFKIVIRTPIGTRISETEKVVASIERAVVETIPKEHLLNVISNVGAARSGSGNFYSTNTGSHSAYVRVELVGSSKRALSTTDYMKRVRARVLKEHPGVLISFDPGGIVKKVLNFGYEAPINVEQRGYDLRVAEKLAKDTVQLLRGIQGLKDVRSSREENYPQFDVVVDREKAALMGVSERDVARALLTSLYGNYSNPPVFSDPRTGNQYFIVTTLQGRFKQKLDDLGNIFLIHRGAPVFLKSFADIRRNSGPVQIDRRYRERVVDVTANVEGRDLGSAAAEVKRRLAGLKVPKGFTVTLRGQSQQQEQTFQSLAVASALALMLVYMVLASQFKNLLHPFIIMFTVPVGLSGVFLMLFLTRTTLSTTSFMGIIMMVGIVVSNGVLLIDCANQLRATGLGIVAAAVEAGRTRLRPILMTASAAILGLIPMALGLAEGSETQAPLARAVIGGLGVSTLLTLFLVPALYVTMEPWRLRRQRARERLRAPQP